MAGGLGSRMGGLTQRRPKPMVTIGGRPILLHIMSRFSSYGLNEFIVALGYKGNVIKEFFRDLEFSAVDMSMDPTNGAAKSKNGYAPDWKVDLIETGARTLTGGRIHRLAPHIGQETFLLCWGDGLSDINPRELLRFHHEHGKIGTLTVVEPPPRFGHVGLEEGRVVTFDEKPRGREGWINAGIFVFEPGIFDYSEGNVQLEKDPLQRLCRDRELMAYRHTSFWQCMDTPQERQALEQLWESGEAPWRAEAG